MSNEDDLLDLTKDWEYMQAKIINSLKVPAHLLKDKPMFKVGDRVKHKLTHKVFCIKEIAGEDIICNPPNGVYTTWRFTFNPSELEFVEGNAVKMNTNFKVGDKVRLRSNKQIRYVKAFEGDYISCSSNADEKSHYFKYHPWELEFVEELSKKEASIIKIGDIVRHKHISYPVMTVTNIVATTARCTWSTNSYRDFFIEHLELVSPSSLVHTFNIGDHVKSTFEEDVKDTLVVEKIEDHNIICRSNSGSTYSINAYDPSRLELVLPIADDGKNTFKAGDKVIHNSLNSKVADTVHSTHGNLVYIGEGKIFDHYNKFRLATEVTTVYEKMQACTNLIKSGAATKQVIDIINNVKDTDDLDDVGQAVVELENMLRYFIDLKGSLVSKYQAMLQIEKLKKTVNTHPIETSK